MSTIDKAGSDAFYAMAISRGHTSFTDGSPFPAPFGTATRTANVPRRSGSRPAWAAWLADRRSAAPGVPDETWVEQFESTMGRLQRLANMGDRAAIVGNVKAMERSNPLLLAAVDERMGRDPEWAARSYRVLPGERRAQHCQSARQRQTRLRARALLALGER